MHISVSIQEVDHCPYPAYDRPASCNGDVFVNDCFSDKGGNVFDYEVRRRCPHVRFLPDRRHFLAWHSDDTHRQFVSLFRAGCAKAMAETQLDEPFENLRQPAWHHDNVYGDK